MGDSGRIAIYLPALNMGGVERVMLALARGLLERGRPVDLVLQGASGELMATIPPEARLIALGAGPSQRDLDPARTVRRLRRLARLLRFRAWLPLAPLLSAYPYTSLLHEYLQRERPSVLMSAMTPWNLVAIWARRRARSETRVVITQHVNLSAIWRQGRGEVGACVSRGLMRRYYPRADAIVAVSRGVADDMLWSAGVPRSRVQVIYNPVVDRRLLENAAEPIDHAWLRPGEPPVVLAAGRLARQKDFPTLIRAFAEVRRVKPARLVILGDGPERTALKALIDALGLAGAVDLPGFTLNPYAYMARAAVFVLSSVFEGLPIVLIEALAVGTPVVSTDCPSGPAEILDGGRYGMLVPVRQADALARALLATLEAPGDSAPRRRRACDFSVDRSVSAYLRLFDSIAADRSTARDSA